MRAVIQRVTRARVVVENKTVASIHHGLVVLLGVGFRDTPKDVVWIADKIMHLRIFADEHGKMNRSLIDLKGSIIAVSQFTLYGDCRKGRRPSFGDAMEPDRAKQLCDMFQQQVESKGIACKTGIFQAHMLVDLCNDGPVTFLLDSEISRRRSTGGFTDPIQSSDEI